MKNIYRFFVIALLLSPIFAKEPENVIIGAGFGAGQSNLSIVHSQIMRNPILGGTGTTIGAPVWNARTNSHSSSWAIAWEVIVGYKHFVNDWVGFRYYADISAQHYKSTEGGKSTQPIGIIDYTANADFLLDFYESEKWAFGIFGGVGFGGTSFLNSAVNQYINHYNTNEGIPIGASDITRHFFNINASVGVRFAFFQKSIISGAKRSCNSFAQGRLSCSSPATFMGHNIEVVAKFPLLEYTATDYDVMAATDGTGKFVSRPGYKIKNPYRFGVRYIIEF